MATDQVPGSNPSNGDQLAMGCWAEAGKDSLLFVEGFDKEQKIVTYSLFDLSTDPITEFRDRMTEQGFRDLFVKGPGKDSNFVWHDKTQFDWGRVAKIGATPGLKYASATDQLSAAARLAKALELKGIALTEKEAAARGEAAGQTDWRRVAQSGAEFMRTLFDQLGKM